jgi:hypothetical protein
MAAADDASPLVTGRRWPDRIPRPLLWALAELFALAGLAITQPLLDVAGRAPDFFLLHSLSRAGILLLVAGIAMVPPLALWALEAMATLVAGERWRRLLHLAMLAGLFVLLAVEAGKKVAPLRGKRLALAALVVGAAAAVLYQRWSGLRLWLRYVAVAPLVFVLTFSLTSPVSKLILPSHGTVSSAAPAVLHPGRPLPPVVMVFFDEFPLQSLLDSKGEVDGRVYPSFARFAADATWYRNATGISGWTPYAVPAMLRGRYPDRAMRGAAPVAEMYPDNLFSLFGHYYDLKVLETVTQLCPPPRCGQGASLAGFGTVVKETARLYRNIASLVDVPVDTAAIDGISAATAPKQGAMALFGNLKQDQPDRLEKFLGMIRASDRQPTLYFLHVLLPHAPWKYLPDGRVYDDPTGRGARRKTGTYPDALNQVGHQRQLLQLAYTDALVGRLLDRLKSQGLYDRSLVLLTADHGSGFSSAATSRSLGGGNEPTLMWVPLFIKTPHQTGGRVDDRNWEHVDLLPTIADIAGLGIPWKVDGFSQAGPPRRQRTEKWWYQTPGQRSVLPGPPNWAKVLHGVTDTLVRAHQNGVRGFYQLGPYADWVYRSPREIGEVTGAAVSAEMARWERFETVTPGAMRSPELIVGKVTSAVPPPGSVMVIAVNGTIGGTGGFYPPKEGGRATGFAVMVPDFLFTKGPGQPQIQAYVATRSGHSVTLQPVRVAGG